MAWRLVAIIALLRAAPALACGNVTHAWISLAARDALPEGSLKAALSTPEGEQGLRNGTMFPDGGYALGDRYGEMAHWPPMHDALMADLKNRYGADFSAPEAARHLGFLFGQVSHGLADELYDVTLQERSKRLDPGWATCEEQLCSFDTATDFLWALETGPQPDPQRFIPDVMPSLFLTSNRYDVTAARLQEGSDQVGKGMWLVSTTCTDTRLQEKNAEMYPLPYAEMTTATGGPHDIAPAVTAFWQALWGRMGGGEWIVSPVVTTRPLEGTSGHPTKAGDPASRILIVSGRGLKRSALTPDSVRLTDGTGANHPFTLKLMYGNQASHTLYLEPDEDLRDGETYTVELMPGLVSYDGAVSTAGHRFSFIAGKAPEAPAPPKQAGCASAGFVSLAMLLPLALRRRRTSRERDARNQPGRPALPTPGELPCAGNGPTAWPRSRA